MPRRSPSYNRSQWQIERERFQLPPGRPPTAYRIHTPGTVVPDLLKKWGMEQALWEQTLLQEWAEIAGPQVAKHTRPGRLDRGTLTVYVAHSTWLTELRQFGQQAMLEKLQARFGRRRIKGIRLNLDPDAPATPAR